MLNWINIVWKVPRLVALPGLLVALLFLTSCEKEVKSPSAAYEGPIEIIDDVGVLYSEGGVLQVSMKTPRQFRYKLDDKVFPDTINIFFYDPEGNNVVTTLRADSGHYDSPRNLYVVKGNVRVVNSVKQERLFTSELNWSPTTKKVYTDKPVRIEQLLTGDVMKGIGLDAAQDFSQTSIRKPTGIFSIEAGTF